MRSIFAAAAVSLTLAAPAFADQITSGPEADDSKPQSILDVAPARDIESSVPEAGAPRETIAAPLTAPRVRETQGAGAAVPATYRALVARHAAANGVPESLVHRVIMRESRYDPRASNAGNYGMMQIRLGTARGLGYRGDVAGLMDADTNMTYAVRYLGGAYRVAGGDHNRAVALYAKGYYYDAKRQGIAMPAPVALVAAPVEAVVSIVTAPARLSTTGAGSREAR